MVNGKSDGAGLIIPVPKASDAPKELTCHRFFAPVVLPEPDALDPRKLNVMPRLGNFNCLKAKCMLWNAEKEECWDLTALKGQAMVGEYAFGKLNDVHIENAGA